MQARCCSWVLVIEEPPGDDLKAVAVCCGRVCASGLLRLLFTCPMEVFLSRPRKCLGLGRFLVSYN